MTLRSGILSVAGLLAAAMLPALGASAQRRPDDSAAGGGDAVMAGATAWDAQNYARALAIWRPLAAAGNRFAQYNLGQAYRLGNGVTRDDKVAADWYRQAAMQGHGPSQANYGLLMFQNGDRKGALPWLQKAADQGDPRAQYVIGTALFNGDLLTKDWVRAYAFMTRASAAGIRAAMTSLAEMDKYIPLNQRVQGTAVARDMERSVTLAEVEADDGQLVKAKPAQVKPAEPAAPRPATPPAIVAAGPPIARPPTPSRAAKPAPPRPVVTPRAPAEAPMRAAAVDGGWRVQVGAFADPAAAGTVWAGIARKAPGLGLRSYLVKAGAVTRLQAGPLASRAEAGKACARISATGAACFPVQAK